MANNALSLRMKYRKLNADQLNDIINNEKSSELEIKIANEFLAKIGDTVETVTKKVAKKAEKVAKKAAEEEEAVTGSEPTKKVAKKAEKVEKDESIEEAAKNQVTEYESDELLTAEEKKRLAKAEKEFDDRQITRKTPSKSDKTMVPKKKAEKVEKAPRETKRQNLEESTEVPGLKVGTKVTLAGDIEVGEIVRIYQSGDGKEKCMVKIGENKPVKKRVTAVEIVEATTAPAKKVAKKK